MAARLATLPVLFILFTGLALAWNLSAGIPDGADLYMQYCESCHGPSGEGFGGMGELTTRGQLLKPDEVLFDTIAQGQMSMPGFDGLLTGEEIRDIILYLRTIQ